MKKDHKAIIVILSMIVVILFVIGLLFYEVNSLMKDENIGISNIQFDFPDIAYYFRNDAAPKIYGDTTYTIGNISYNINDDFMYKEVKQENGKIRHHYQFVNDNGKKIGATMDVGLYYEANVINNIKGFNDVQLNVYQELSDYDCSESNETSDDGKNYYILSTDEKNSDRKYQSLIIYEYVPDHIIFFSVYYAGGYAGVYSQDGNDINYNELIDTIQTN